MAIRTSHVFPPVPVRQFDWCAFIDGNEEAREYGWGRTEQEAINALLVLLAQYDEENSSAVQP